MCPLCSSATAQRVASADETPTLRSHATNASCGKVGWGSRQGILHPDSKQPVTELLQNQDLRDAYPQAALVWA